MWRIFNKIFGWDYASVQFGFSSYTQRVYDLPGFRRCVIICGNTIELYNDGKDSRGSKYIPLTWQNIIKGKE